MAVRVHLFALVCLLVASFSRAQVPVGAIIVESHLDGCYADCPLIPLPSYYVFCFRLNGTTVIAGHESWYFGLKKLASLQGERIPIKYDDGHVWAKLPSGWSVKLDQYWYEYPFRDEACRAEAQLRSFQHGYTRPAPVPGEPATPVMRGALVSGWALCHGPSPDGIKECTVWDLKGNIRRRDLYEPVVGATALEDATTDAAFSILHLGNGQVMRLRALTFRRTFP